jgi:hypothetical protein
MRIKISSGEIRKYLDAETPDFPKYASPLINLANRYAQGTRPRIVGQLSDLIQEFEGKTLVEWERWYLDRKPDAIRMATERILEKLKEFENSIANIDRETIERWVRDLVIVKTFTGLRLQGAILKRGAEIKGTDFRFSGPEEESQGIDGFLGSMPVSIKPHTYKLKAELADAINAKLIYYEKTDDGIDVDFGDVL